MRRRTLSPFGILVRHAFGDANLFVQVVADRFLGPAYRSPVEAIRHDPEAQAV